MNNVNNVTKWIGHHFETGLENGSGDDFKRFARNMKADLKKKADGIGFELIGFNRMYYEFDAVLYNGAADQYVYVSVPDVRFFEDQWYTHVLYRTMANDHDWTGGNNHFCCWDELPEEISLLVSHRSAYTAG